MFYYQIYNENGWVTDNVAVETLQNIPSGAKQVSQSEYEIFENNYRPINFDELGRVLPAKFIQNYSNFVSDCYRTIVEGCDVVISGEIKHFSMQETDQLNLINALASNKTEFIYHVDGESSKIFTRTEIELIIQTLNKHREYQQAYLGLLKIWWKRATSYEELEKIVWGAQLPEDLQNELDNLFT